MLTTGQQFIRICQLSRKRLYPTNLHVFPRKPGHFLTLLIPILPCFWPGFSAQLVMQQITCLSTRVKSTRLVLHYGNIPKIKKFTRTSPAPSYYWEIPPILIFLKMIIEPLNIISAGRKSKGLVNMRIKQNLCCDNKIINDSYYLTKQKSKHL